VKTQGSISRAETLLGSKSCLMRNRPSTWLFHQPNVWM